MGMVTLLDIAHAAGVSKMTVSNALRGKSNVSEAVRERIIRTANELNYQTNLAARALSSGRNNIIEFIVQDLDSPFYGELAKEVSRAADRHGMQTLIRQSLYSAENEKSAMTPANSLFCDGLILATPKLDDAEAQRLAQQRPLILIDACAPHPQASTVNTPNYEGARQAVAHLLSTGVRRPLILGAGADATSMIADDGDGRKGDAAGRGDSPDNGTPRTVGGLRLAGAMRAVRDAGAPIDAPLCAPVEWTYDQARQAIHDLIDAGERFDGVFGMSDVVALGAIRGLADRGLKVPEDVKVIGFDGTTYGAIATPSLSTIDIDMPAMAETIVDRLMEQLERRGTGRQSAGGAYDVNAPASSPSGDAPNADDPITVDTAPFTLRVRESTAGRQHAA
ncbi:hypothetical protein CSQ85_08750 [Bifidobacterium rousetti]|nr:hypothetical protein CSQ85_08750 [Bifidobacterium rousetti]